MCFGVAKPGKSMQPAIQNFPRSYSLQPHAAPSPLFWHRYDARKNRSHCFSDCMRPGNVRRDRDKNATMVTCLFGNRMGLVNMELVLMKRGNAG